MLQVKIRVFSFFDEPFYGFIMYLCQSSASRTHHLYARGLTDNEFIFGSGSSSLSVMCVQNLCQKEEVETVIYRCHRDPLYLTDLYQFFRRKRLRQETYLFKHHIPDSGGSHAFFTDIGTQLLDGQIMYLGADHYISFKYARRRLWRILSTRLKKSKILLFVSSMEVVSSCFRPYLAKIGIRS